MSPDEYAAAVDRVAHAMKLAESGLELVACGSSSAHMSTFGSWERSVLTKAYDNLDFVSCHAYYYERGAKSLQDYLASSQDMQTFISTVAACADEAKNAHTGDHDIALSFDEWGVWYPTSGISRKLNGKPNQARIFIMSHGRKHRVCSKISTMQPMQW